MSHVDGEAKYRTLRAETQLLLMLASAIREHQLSVSRHKENESGELGAGRLQASSPHSPATKRAVHWVTSTSSKSFGSWFYTEIQRLHRVSLQDLLLHALSLQAGNVAEALSTRGTGASRMNWTKPGRRGKTTGRAWPAVGRCLSGPRRLGVS